MIVIDASVVLEWLLDDQRAAEAEAILIEAADDQIVTPPLFWLEVANALRTRLRRGQIDEAFRDASLARIRALGLSSIGALDAPDAVLERTVALSDKYDLTVYDAAYLELALRLGAGLRTFDDALARAAAAAGVLGR